LQGLELVLQQLLMHQLQQTWQLLNNETQLTPHRLKIDCVALQKFLNQVVLVRKLQTQTTSVRLQFKLDILLELQAV